MSTAIKGIDNAFQKGVSSMGSDNLYIVINGMFNNSVPCGKPVTVKTYN